MVDPAVPVGRIGMCGGSGQPVLQRVPTVLDVSPQISIRQIGRERDGTGQHHCQIDSPFNPRQRGSRRLWLMCHKLFSTRQLYLSLDIIPTIAYKALVSLRYENSIWRRET